MATLRGPSSCRDLQPLPGEQSEGFAIAGARRCDHDRRQWGRRVVAVPFPVVLEAREEVAQRLLVETWLARAGGVPVGGPEARGIGRQDLVDHEQGAVRRRAELEFRVGDDDALAGGEIAAALVEGEAGALQ